MYHEEGLQSPSPATGKISLPRVSSCARRPMKQALREISGVVGGDQGMPCIIP